MITEQPPFIIRSQTVS